MSSEEREEDAEAGNPLYDPIKSPYGVRLSHVRAGTVLESNDCDNRKSGKIFFFKPLKHSKACQAPSPSPPPPPPRSCYVDLGCYKDQRSRALRSGPRSYRSSDRRRYTVKTCKARCRQYRYIAVQNNGRGCHCDNSFRSATKYGTTTCAPRGGTWKNYIWDTKSCKEHTGEESEFSNITDVQTDATLDEASLVLEEQDEADAILAETKAEQQSEADKEKRVESFYDRLLDGGSAYVHADERETALNSSGLVAQKRYSGWMPRQARYPINELAAEAISEDVFWDDEEESK